MALSSQDVHDKQFKLVRNSTGYDMDEVDAFLDEVEAEIARLTDEVGAAQEQLAAASARARGGDHLRGRGPDPGDGPAHGRRVHGRRATQG